MSLRSISWSCVVSAVLALGAAGCASSPASPQEAAPAAATTVVTLPESAHRTFIDFGGKIHLVGYELSPDRGGPGDTLALTLYWKPVSRIEPGWNLYTHLVDDEGHQLWNYDREGAFRSLLAGGSGLSMLETGQIYVDQQSLQLPKSNELGARVGIVVGVWQGDMRLPVVSGTTDGHEGGVVVRFSTGLPRVVPQKETRKPH